jgi:hypothetical protein
VKEVVVKGPADVLAFLIDFGIGNAIEKHAALDGATARIVALERERVSRCTVQASRPE